MVSCRWASWKPRVPGWDVDLDHVVAHRPDELNLAGQPRVVALNDRDCHNYRRQRRHRRQRRQRRHASQRQKSYHGSQKTQSE